jgi:ParB-like chromosome segregation protein Spo0J
MQKLFSLSKIKPNPFRYMDRYPIQRDKVEALKQSFRRTGFWENIVAREVKGHAEIAYGHHRLVALQEEMGPRAKVPLIIKDLDDGAMLQMMARENMDEWRTSAVVEQETVRAVVEAYAAGKIALPEIPKDTKKAVIRHAPSYVQGEETGGAQERPYTATAIAEFLGWADPKIHTTLSALELIEQEVLKEGHFEGLTTKQAEALTTETKKTKRTYDTAAKAKPGEKAKKKAENRGKREAAKVAEHVAEKLQTGEIGYKQVSQEANKFRAKPGGKAVPEAEALADQLVEHIDGVLSRGDPNLEMLNQVIKHQKRLGKDVRRRLRVALDRLSDRCLRFEDSLEGLE